jgi:hypothetical protein
VDRVEHGPGKPADMHASVGLGVVGESYVGRVDGKDLGQRQRLVVECIDMACETAPGVS